MKRILQALLLYICGAAISHAQIPESLDALIDQQVDSLFDSSLEQGEDTIPLTPEQTWLKSLVYRVDSVSRRPITFTTTTRDRRRRLVKRTVNSSHRIGVTVYDLTADSTIYSLNDTLLYIPASTQKLFISVAALSNHGMKHTYHSRVFSEGTVMHDTIVVESTMTDPLAATLGDDEAVITVSDTILRPFLRGNIILRGGYDPTFSSDHLRRAADAVRSYANSLGIDSIDGRILIDDGFDRYITSSRSANSSLSQARTLHRYILSDGISFSQKDPCQTVSRSMTNPRQNQNMHHLLTISTPLSDVLPRMMKRSNNDYAESLLLTLMSPDSDSWSYDGCRKIVRDLTTAVGGPSSDYEIIDGSGLSHSNKSTPRLQVKLLRYASLNPHIYNPLYDALPIAGVDGTISERMLSAATRHNVRAKTGTVNGVSTLAGYVTASNGHKLAFSIMVNNVSSSSLGRKIQDEICYELAR